VLFQEPWISDLATNITNLRLLGIDFCGPHFGYNNFLGPYKKHLWDSIAPKMLENVEEGNCDDDLLGERRIEEDDEAWKDPCSERNAAARRFMTGTEAKVAETIMHKAKATVKVILRSYVVALL